MSEIIENETMVEVEDLSKETLDVEVDGGIKTDLDESLDAIEREKEREDELYDEENNFIGSPEEVPGADELDLDEDEVDWSTPEFTPTGSDIPMSFEILEAVAESLEMEGDVILDILGPSGNEEFDSIIVEKKATVSYPEPGNPGKIVTQVLPDDESNTAEVEGLTVESPDDEFLNEDCDEDCDESEDEIELSEDDLEV